ncbi:hypothetical protein PR048_004215 [Dryococelus australis]|uniref:Uncharacterized protein n=1 Tax=Dryococelus australis TaxID=614101 RepID=A0ABQ9I4V3_9NEOP|nr:hypothetical protein PR048_004215 [Dryococelus australis]
MRFVTGSSVVATARPRSSSLAAACRSVKVRGQHCTQSRSEEGNISHLNNARTGTVIEHRTFGAPFVLDTKREPEINSISSDTSNSSVSLTELLEELFLDEAESSGLPCPLASPAAVSPRDEQWERALDWSSDSTPTLRTERVMYSLCSWNSPKCRHAMQDRCNAQCCRGRCKCISALVQSPPLSRQQYGFPYLAVDTRAMDVLSLAKVLHRVLHLALRSADSLPASRRHAGRSCATRLLACLLTNKPPWGCCLRFLLTHSAEAGILFRSAVAPSLLHASATTRHTGNVNPWDLNCKQEAAVAQRLERSLLIKANWVRFRAGSLPDFRTRESCRPMPLVGGFSRISPVFSLCCIRALLRAHLVSPSSTLKTPNSHTNISSPFSCKPSPVTHLGGRGHVAQEGFVLIPCLLCVEEVCWLGERCVEGASWRLCYFENCPGCRHLGYKHTATHVHTCRRESNDGEEEEKLYFWFPSLLAIRDPPWQHGEVDLCPLWQHRADAAPVNSTTSRRLHIFANSFRVLLGLSFEKRSTSLHWFHRAFHLNILLAIRTLERPAIEFRDVEAIDALRSCASKMQNSVNGNYVTAIDFFGSNTGNAIDFFEQYSYSNIGIILFRWSVYSSTAVICYGYGINVTIEFFGSPTSVMQSITSLRFHCCYCDSSFSKTCNSRRHERTVCMKSPLRAMKLYDNGHMQFMQGDRMNEHIEIWKGSSTGSQQVMSAIHSAILVATLSADDYDETDNAKDGMSASVWDVRGEHIEYVLFRRNFAASNGFGPKVLRFYPGSGFYGPKASIPSILPHCHCTLMSKRVLSTLSSSLFGPFTNLLCHCTALYRYSSVKPALLANLRYSDFISVKPLPEYPIMGHRKFAPLATCRKSSSLLPILVANSSHYLWRALSIMKFSGLHVSSVLVLCVGRGPRYAWSGAARLAGEVGTARRLGSCLVTVVASDRSSPATSMERGAGVRKRSPLSFPVIILPATPPDGRDTAGRLAGREGVIGAADREGNRKFSKVDFKREQPILQLLCGRRRSPTATTARRGRALCRPRCLVKGQLKEKEVVHISCFTRAPLFYLLHLCLPKKKKKSGSIVATTMFASVSYRKLKRERGCRTGGYEGEKHLHTILLPTEVLFVAAKYFRKGRDKKVVEVFGVDEGETRWYGATPGMQGREKQEILEKTRRPEASCGTIPTCENMAAALREPNPVRLDGRRSMSHQSQCSRFLQAPSRTAGFTRRFHTLSAIQVTNTSFAVILSSSTLPLHSRTLARRPPLKTAGRGGRGASQSHQNILASSPPAGERGRDTSKAAKQRDSPKGRFPLFTGFPGRGIRRPPSASFQEERRAKWVSDYGAGQQSRCQLQHLTILGSEKVDSNGEWTIVTPPQHAGCHPRLPLVLQSRREVASAGWLAWEEGLYLYRPPAWRSKCTDYPLAAVNTNVDLEHLPYCWQRITRDSFERRRFVRPMERRWNARAWGTGLPRENPPASGIVTARFPHPGVNPLGIEPRIAVVGSELPSHCTTAATMSRKGYTKHGFQIVGTAVVWVWWSEHSPPTTGSVLGLISPGFQQTIPRVVLILVPDASGTVLREHTTCLSWILLYVAGSQACPSIPSTCLHVASPLSRYSHCPFYNQIPERFPTLPTVLQRIKQDQALILAALVSGVPLPRLHHFKTFFLHSFSPQSLAEASVLR